MYLKPGDTVINISTKAEYKVIQLIGNGSFGIVYEIQDTENRPYALKTINTEFLDNAQFQSLVNEGNLSTSILHENVLRVLSFHNGQEYSHLPPYIIMEYANGGNLEQFLNNKRASNIQLTSEELSNLVLSLASGMQAINDKLIHRDIKPDNILFVNGIPKIADFGLSKIVGDSTRSRTFKGINHIKYCAPEAWRLDTNSPAMDMYSMGIVFYELATLGYPYKVNITTGDLIENFRVAHFTQVPIFPQVLNPSLDIGVAQMIVKMMDKHPAARYSSWNEIISRIRSSTKEDPVSAHILPLVQKALENREKIEQERLKREEDLRHQQEADQIIDYCFQEIVQAVESIVVEFNKTSEFAKLEIQHLHPFSLAIYKKGDMSHRVIIVILPIYGRHLLDGHKIKAWGHVKAPSGHGFNMLLVETNSDDIYGEWKTFHVSHSALARRVDQRPDPFPFELNELPRELQCVYYKTRCFS
jgi:serine/threonine protein kinase